MYVRKAKQISLGNIRFIGALFKIGMLNESVVQRCILQLLCLELIQVDGQQAARTTGCASFSSR